MDHDSTRSLALVISLEDSKKLPDKLIGPASSPENKGLQLLSSLDQPQCPRPPTMGSEL